MKIRSLSDPFDPMSSLTHTSSSGERGDGQGSVEPSVREAIIDRAVESAVVRNVKFQGDYSSLDRGRFSGKNRTDHRLRVQAQVLF